MRWNKTLVVGTALVLSTACGGVDDQEYVEALPDLPGTALELNSDATAREGAALVAADLMRAEAALDGEGAAMLEGARMQVQALNAALKQALEPVAALVKQSADARKGDVLVYGPEDRANATFKLTVRKATAARYVWKLEARPLGSTDDAAYKLVAAGGVARGVKVHRGRGTLGIHLDNLKAVAPSFAGQGKLMMSYAHTASDDKALAYRLKDFTPDTAKHAPVTGAFVGHKLMPSGITRARVFGPYDLPRTVTDAKETVLSSVRYFPKVGGRVDIRAWGGDIGAGKYFIGSACWDGQEQEVFRVLRQCTEGAPLTSCVEVADSRMGTREACPGAELRGDIEPPSGGVDDITPEPGAPESPDAVPPDVTAEL